MFTHLGSGSQSLGCNENTKSQNKSPQRNKITRHSTHLLQRHGQWIHLLQQRHGQWIHLLQQRHGQWIHLLSKSKEQIRSTIENKAKQN
jgi:hypothetical protein